MFRLGLNVFFGAKVALISGCEKALQQINTTGYASVKQLHEGIQGLSEKITQVAGTAGGQARESVDAANNLLAAGVTPESKMQAAQLISQAKINLSQMYNDQYGFFFNVASINWLHFCVILFFICIAVMVLLSLVTKAPEIEQLKYTFGSSTAAEKAETRASWNTWDIIHTCIIMGIVIAFYLYFW
jgi:SSS family solute:Na+ symporter